MALSLVAVAVGTLWPVPASAAGGTIGTVAGTGVSGYTGDGGPATAAELSLPAGVAVDGAGDIFIADAGNNAIRKISTNGTISSVAGTGAAGFSGDGGPATAARLSNPTDVVVDGAGDLFIADYGNHRIRKVSPSGRISTFAGTGANGYSGDGGPALQAGLSNPVGEALDTSGDLLFADYGNHTVRKVDTAGVISTVAGTGTAGYSGDGGSASAAQLRSPAEVVANGATVLISDAGNARVRSVSATGVISTIAGTGTSGYSGDGGPATAAKLAYPAGLARDSSGNVFIADFTGNTIREIVPSGLISTVAGTGIAGYSGDSGPAAAAQLNGPSRVNLDAAGNFYISDYNNHRIRKVTALGAAATAPGTPTGVSATGGDGQASVRWTAPASDGGAALTSYTLTPYANGTTALPARTVTAPAGTATVTGLTNGTPYTFTVAATNSVGTGAASAPSSPVTPTAAATAPGTLTVTGPAGPSSDRTPTFTLSGEPGGTWRCVLTDPTGSTRLLACGPGSLTPDLTGADGKYTLAVTQTDPAGNVSPTTTVGFLLDTTAPAAPTVTEPTAGSSPAPLRASRTLVRPTATAAAPVVRPAARAALIALPAPYALGALEAARDLARITLRTGLGDTRWRDLLRVAGAVARVGGVPGLLLLLALLFFYLQDRIDRDDPKLALAPVHTHQELGFRAPGGRET